VRSASAWVSPSDVVPVSGFSALNPPWRGPENSCQFDGITRAMHGGRLTAPGSESQCIGPTMPLAETADSGHPARVSRPAALIVLTAVLSACSQHSVDTAPASSSSATSVAPASTAEARGQVTSEELVTFVASIGVD
jgi:hypothetical protein